MNIFFQLTSKLYLMFLNSIKNQSDLDLVLFYVVLVVVFMALISIFAVISSTQKQKLVHHEQINLLDKQVEQCQVIMNKHRLSTSEFDYKQNVILEKIEWIKYHTLGLRLILKSINQA